jgi:alpha-L-fucosidase
MQLPNDIYQPAEWILDNLIGITAKGRNFEVGFGPMPNGRWPPGTVERLEYVGKWLQVNGEAIYNTRPGKIFREGSSVLFTGHKTGDVVHAISIGWPGQRLAINSLRGFYASNVFILGVERPLDCHQESRGLVIDIPQAAVAEKKVC